MLGFGEVILALIGFAFIIAFLSALGIGVWKVVHKFKRQHRLEKEADDRAHKKALADDYADSIKMLNGMGVNDTMTFKDYNSDKVLSYSKGGKVK